MKKALENAAYATLCCFAAIILIYPEISENAILSTLRTTVRGVVPSLFPFMVISSMLCDLPTPALLTKIASPFCELLRIPKIYATSLAVGNLCGFPVGASSVSEIAIKYGNEKKTALRAAVISNNVSISFACAFVGSVLRGGKKAALVLWVCQLAASFSVCALSSLFCKKEAENKQEYPNTEYNIPLSESFANSVVKAAESSLSIASFICFFSVISAYISSLAAKTGNIFSEYFFSFLLEISFACEKSSELDFPLCVVICAFCMGFSCICVIFQSSVFLNRAGISVMSFCAMKFLQGIISALFAYLAFRFIKFDFETATVGAVFDAQIPFIIVSLVLIVIYFFAITKKR